MIALGRACLLATIVFLYLPIAVMVAMAFNDSDFYTLPIKPSLRWFAVLANNGPLLAATRNSLVIACATSAIATALGTLAALALERRRFRGRSLLRTLLLPPIAIPWLITGTAMLVFFFWTGIGRGIHALLIGHVALAIPYVVLVVGTGMQTLRADLEEAAMSSRLDAGSCLLLDHLAAPAPQHRRRGSLRVRGISRPVRRLVFSRDARREHAAGRDLLVDPQGLYAGNQRDLHDFSRRIDRSRPRLRAIVESRRKT